MTEPRNAAGYLVDRQVERGYGNRIAVTGPSESLTYAELAQRVAVASTAWRSIGLRPGERVMCYAADQPDLLIALLSVMRCGAVPVPVSTLYSGSELARLLRDSGAGALVVDTEHTEQADEILRAAPAHLHVVVTLGATAIRPSGLVRTLTWKELVTCGDSDTTAPPEPVSHDSSALWLYTSGSTGTPKAAMHRHGSIRFVAEAYGQGVLGLGADDRCFSASKLSFAFGLGNSCFLPLAAAASTILEPARPTPQNLLRRVVQDRPTIFFAVPSIYASLLRAPDVPTDAFSSVRFAVSAGEQLPVELQRRFQARFGIELVNGLGMTETLHIFVSNRPGHGRPGSIGTVVPGNEIQILAEGGTPAEPGRPGALLVRAPSSATGYWACDAAASRVFRGEWIDTGDLVRLDASGHYVYLGRATDMIKSGGVWVSPTEVEARLLLHPTVSEAVVVGIEDEHGLERPVACVVATPNRRIDTDELVGFCRSDLPSYKRPRRVLAFDSLPTNSAGKVQRHLLRTAAIERLNSLSGSPHTGSG
jgi:benzoate-CoA ligase family protein